MDKEQQKKAELQFLENVKDHQLEIIRDDGVHRHLRFKRPETISYYFDILTWPGKLCISGDCGTWVFARIHDMFDFFRTDERDFNYNRDGGLSINPGYWSEKLLAVDRNGRHGGDGAMAFSQDLFEKSVKDYVQDATSDWSSEHMLEQKEELENAISDDVLNPDTEEDAYRRISDFKHAYYDDEGKRDTFQFYDFFGYNLREYTHHFIWNLFAIAYAIREYDKSLLAKPKAAS
jgi:hypothetical protein